MNFYFSMSLRSTKAEPLAPIEDVNTVYHSSSSTHLMMLWNGVETTCVPALMVQTIPFPLWNCENRKEVAIAIFAFEELVEHDTCFLIWPVCFFADDQPGRLTSRPFQKWNDSSNKRRKGQVHQTRGLEQTPQDNTDWTTPTWCGDGLETHHCPCLNTTVRSLRLKDKRTNPPRQLVLKAFKHRFVFHFPSVLFIREWLCPREQHWNGWETKDGQSFVKHSGNFWNSSFTWLNCIKNNTLMKGSRHPTNNHAMDKPVIEIVSSSNQILTATQDLILESLFLENPQQEVLWDR